MTEDTQPSLRDRAMALLLELQAEDRQANVNEGELAALAANDAKTRRLNQALGLDSAEEAEE